MDYTILNIIIAFLFVVLPIGVDLPMYEIYLEYRDYKKEGKKGETFRQFSARNQKRYL